jgi:hypothetical protein
MRHRMLSIVLAFVLLLPPVTSRRVVAAEATDYVRARIEKIYDVLGGAAASRGRPSFGASWPP